MCCGAGEARMEVYILNEGNMRHKKIVLVSTDNTTLSIMAEAVMKTVLRQDREVISRGLVVLFPEPLNPKAVAVLKGNQMEPAKEKSEPLTAEDLEGGGVLVLTMTETECNEVRARYGESKADIYPLGVFANKPGDIVVPHGGSLADYGACYEYIDLVVKMAAEIISGE